MDSNIKSVKKYIRDRFNGILDVEVIVSSQEYWVKNNPSTTWGEYLLFNLRRTFGLMQNPDARLIRFIAPIAYSDDVRFDMNNMNTENVSNVIKMVRILKDKDNGIFNRIKDKNLSYSELYNSLSPIIQNDKDMENHILQTTDFGEFNENYQIIEDADYKTAQKYGNKSCPNSKLCYTQSDNTWNNYTKNGLYKCYILVTKDYDEIKSKHTEPVYDFLPTNAYDKYGLSMIMFFVSPENEIVTSNTRWNHEAKYGNRSVDNALTKVDISKIIGANFANLFDGYSKEELKQKGLNYIKFEEVQGLLDSGVKPEDIFEWAGDFIEGFARVKMNDKWNFINAEGKIISQQWFGWGYDFKEGFASIKLNGKYNFINAEGKIISQQWFGWGYDFKEGFASVNLNGKYNFINGKGEILSKQWFDDSYPFSEGFTKVQLNGKWNLMDINGEYLSEQWFDYGEIFHGGFARVNLNEKWNFINTNGEYLSDQWFDDAFRFTNGFAKVKLNDKLGFINTNGKCLYNQWLNQWFEMIC